MSTLRHREHRQRLSLHARLGTVTFFRNRPWLARTVPGRRALHVAHVWIPILRRELAETRDALRPRFTAATSYARASWYGPGFYGNRTACGLTLTTSLFGVANRTLACGTRLVVCYRGRCADASVVDRGPYVGGRDFDLTGGLAVYLGFAGVDTISWAIAP